MIRLSLLYYTPIFQIRIVHRNKKINFLCISLCNFPKSEHRLYNKRILSFQSYLCHCLLIVNLHYRIARRYLTQMLYLSRINTAQKLFSSSPLPISSWRIPFGIGSEPYRHTWKTPNQSRSDCCTLRPPPPPSPPPRYHSAGSVLLRCAVWWHTASENIRSYP